MGIPRLQIGLEQANVVTERLVSSVVDMESNITERLDSLSLIEASGKIIDIEESTEPVSKFCLTAQETLFEDAHRKTGAKHSPRIQSARTTPCSCNCHAPTAMRTPQWLDSAIGSLLISYSRTTSGPCLPCSRRHCKVDHESTFRSRYYFPPWMLHRMFFFQCRWDMLGGCNFALRTPRAVSSRSTIFTLAQHGNIGELQSLFEQRRASPYDISIEEGRSALHVRENRRHTGGSELSAIVVCCNSTATRDGRLSFEARGRSTARGSQYAVSSSISQTIRH